MSEAGDFLVAVEVRFIERESEPEARRYVFAYTITIANRGFAPARLISRYWRITDGEGQLREVSGTGVVGRQPLIGPGESFRYTSAAIIETPVGSMEGHYEFEGQSRFRVPIPPFSLARPDQVH